ncbi:MAG: O-antigen ligase family protein, partial [Actinomycetota bacterium]
GRAAALVLAVGGFLLLTASALGLMEPQLAAGLVVMATIGAVGYRWILTWHRLVALLVLVILFIPIRRYGFVGDLPFQLEPYRVLVGLVIGAWVASLLADPETRVHKSGFEGPMALLVVAVLASVVANPGRVGDTSSYVTKDLMFLASFLLLFYAIVSVIRDRGAIDLLLKLLVSGGAAIAVFTVIEARTGYNVFNHLESWIPGLQLVELPEVPGRGVRLRSYASSQHPIALSAVLVIMMPLAIYLAHRTRNKLWLLMIAVLFVGVASTNSRTGLMMLAVVGLVFLWLRPAETRRLWPALVPGFVAVQLLVPGTLGSIKESFFPEGGLIGEQQQFAGWEGSGRLADLGPSLEEWSYQPLFGQGYGTRITDPGPDQNALILDDQWLLTLLETGALGFVAWAWLLSALVRRLGRDAKRDMSDRGWLKAALAASIAAFGAGMLTYDTFSFIQVTFVFFVLAAIAGVVMQGGDTDRSPLPVRRDARPSTAAAAAPTGAGAR